jgi:putative IMPACT (imprinted ancient) family translation regulator
MKYFYKTILSNKSYEIPKIKWSKFIGHIFHIKNKQEAESIIKDFKEKNKEATHNCYAYTYWTNVNFDLFWNLEISPKYFKQSDDWEPINTAWKPILAQIQWHNLHNVLIIVTRYFWWTLLWIWWLIQAYWECTKQIILNSQIKELEITETHKIYCNYDEIWDTINLLKKYDAKILNQENWEKVTIEFEINKGNIKTVQWLND